MLNPDKRTADLRGLTKYPRPSCHSISPDPGPAKKGIFSNQPSQRKDLLIVDDDSSITGMLSELLAEWGYEVFHAWEC